MGRKAGYREHDYTYHTDSYIQGNTVRNPIPQPQRIPRRRYEEQEQPQVSRKVRRNRQKALQFNLGYVALLTVAAVSSLLVCINYLQLQTQNISHRNEVTALESQLLEKKSENDTEYEMVFSSVDLEYIKDAAINRLGMVYANEGQIITYNSQENDYVRQYEDVPTE